MYVYDLNSAGSVMNPIHELMIYLQIGRGWGSLILDVDRKVISVCVLLTNITIETHSVKVLSVLIYVVEGIFSESLIQLKQYLTMKLYYK